MRKATKARRITGWLTMASVALLLAPALAGCEGEGYSEVRSYVDSAGRSCTVDLADISLTATCDADPAAAITCDGGREAAFVLYDDYDFDTMVTTRMSCPACIDREAHESYIGDPCATVSCETDDDCLNRDGDTHPLVCASGVCRSQ